jgi:hypothetical protein
LTRSALVALLGGGTLMLAALLAGSLLRDPAAPETGATTSASAPAGAIPPALALARGGQARGPEPIAVEPSAAVREDPFRDLPPSLFGASQRYRAAGSEESRSEALLELALSDEPRVLPALLDLLAETAEGARGPLLDAVVQVGSRDAVPRLRELAASTGSPDERAQLEAAADYLELPSLTEVRRGLVDLRRESADPRP